MVVIIIFKNCQIVIALLALMKPGRCRLPHQLRMHMHTHVHVRETPGGFINPASARKDRGVTMAALFCFFSFLS